jgi:3-deoxy-D-manno-octulosonic-acid transferase
MHERGSQRMSLRQQASLWAYQLLTRVLQLALPWKLAKRARQEPGYAWRVDARFGRYGHKPHTQRDWLWVHAVSLGETRACAPLVAALRTAYPGARLLLTHGTATGLEAGKALLQAGDEQTWLPWDSASAVHGFLQHYKPRLGLLMETEVWPQLALSCAAMRVPLYLVNARMSQRSLAKAQRLNALSSLAFGALAGAVAQTEADAQRLQALGASVLGVAGNLKFDMSPNAALVVQGTQLGQRWAKPVVMLASSRDTEEAMWLHAVAQLPAAERAQTQWLVVPRHPQRVAQVEQLLLDAGWRVSRRSSWTTGVGGQLEPQPLPVPVCVGLNRSNEGRAQDLDADEGDDKDKDKDKDKGCVWLGDSTGEMAMYYAMSRVALLGGSFAPLGGQNLIEAAACGCVVVAGPHTFNFVQATEQAVQAGACLRAGNMSDAVLAALSLLAQAQDYAQRSQAAVEWTLGHRGAAERTVALLPALKV